MSAAACGMANIARRTEYQCRQWEEPCHHSWILEWNQRSRPQHCMREGSWHWLVRIFLDAWRSSCPLHPVRISWCKLGSYKEVLEFKKMLLFNFITVKVHPSWETFERCIFFTPTLMLSSGFYVNIMYIRQHAVAPYCFPAVILRAQINVKDYLDPLISWNCFIAAELRMLPCTPTLEALFKLCKSFHWKLFWDSCELCKFNATISLKKKCSRFILLWVCRGVCRTKRLCIGMKVRVR